MRSFWWCGNVFAGISDALTGPAEILVDGPSDDDAHHGVCGRSCPMADVLVVVGRPTGIACTSSTTAFTSSRLTAQRSWQPQSCEMLAWNAGVACSGVLSSADYPQMSSTIHTGRH